MKIQSLSIRTRQLDAQYRFYAERLGFEVVSRYANAFTMKMGATQITLVRATPGIAPIHHIALNIPEHQFHRALAWARVRVAVMKVNNNPVVDFRAWDAHSFYFEDAGGHVIELIARHRLPAPDAPNLFTARSIQRVSEVGLASPNVPALSATLQRDLALPVFSGAGSQTFSALGDDHGLLILVKAGRRWYPTTNRPAMIDPVKIGITDKRSLIANISHLPYHISSVIE